MMSAKSFITLHARKLLSQDITNTATISYQSLWIFLNNLAHSFSSPHRGKQTKANF